MRFQQERMRKYIITCMEQLAILEKLHFLHQTVPLRKMSKSELIIVN